MTWLPKVPLFELIPGYIVRARGEDILLAIGLLVYGIQLLRGKVTLRSPLTLIFIYYAVVGILVMLNAMFIVKTLPLNTLHVGKMVLHFARRLEYFSIFFLFYGAMRRKVDIRLVYFAIVTIMLGVTIYGFGQRYLYWPVYSTMNREFSKGIQLVLTEHARVPSTFAGHYDLAAFTMLILTVILAGFFLVKNVWIKLASLGVFAVGFWLLILASSRSSFLAYIISIGSLLMLLGIWKKSVFWFISRGVVVMGLSLFVMISFGDLSGRFSQLGIIKEIQTKFSSLLKPIKEQPHDTIAVAPLDKTDQLPVAPTPIPTPIPTPTLIPTPTPISTPTPIPKPTPRPTLAPKLKATPTPEVSKKPLPPDVYVNIPDLKVVSATVGGKTISKVIEVEREFSPCTYQYGLSACIRFDTLWPRAIRGFLRNPLLGSGYSTLNKSLRDQFTEAESTDNDFLRNAGESGILGLVGFFGPIVIFLWFAVKNLKQDHDPLATAFILGMMAGSLGLLFNALYIDVFEASKVAFMYWALIGIAFALFNKDVKKPRKR